MTFCIHVAGPESGDAAEEGDESDPDDAGEQHGVRPEGRGGHHPQVRHRHLQGPHQEALRQ